MTIKDYTEYKEAEILRLYAEVGWTAYTDAPDTLRKGFENSLLTLAAYEGTTLLGLVRAVGDGHTIIFVQDILVGIGSALLRAVLERYADVRQIELVTDNTPETRVFYQSAGFQELSEIDCCGFMKT